MSAEALVGQTIGGCMILEVIGQGGMGVIYKARQKSLDRIVALKVLAAHLANDINFVSRFQKEARAIARINHPNILAVYDVGDDQNTNYMIMELIDGQSLAELQVERRGALPWEEATNYIKQAAAGLEAAQASGIIHRDIKPENLMITKKGVIKVSDFGLAKDADSTNTSTDAVMGTPAFMSPEQCDGKNVDARSDIYSLGGTYYRLITGRLPFEAETAMSMMYRHKHEALIPPHEVVPTLPQWISAIILKMMAKKREHRYQTMTEVIDSLEAGMQQTLSPKPGTGLLGGLPPPAVAEPADVPASGLLADSNTIPRGSARMSAVVPRSNAQSGRLTAGPGGLFGGGADSGSRLGIPSGIMGMPASGLNVPDDGFTNVARGDEMIARGERMNALKAYQAALQSKTIDNATRQRIEAEIKKEVSARRQAADSFLKRGQLLEANRELKVVVDLDPLDQAARSVLKDVDAKLGQRRTIVNEIRNALASSQFEKAIKIWDTTPPELRDETQQKTIEQLRTIVVPSLKLAEQGDNFSRQGRLEEAIATFEDALKINPTCEAARQGLKDTEQKVQRIEFMLKEGLQFSLEQDYSKAIDTWAPILQIRPGHTQTIKNMVDAYVAHGQNLRAQGNIEAALGAFRGALDTDPQNRNVKRLVDETNALWDKIQVLEDRANESRKRNKIGEAIGHWREIQRLNPSGKEAPVRIAELSKHRSGFMAKLVAVLVLIAILGAAGYQYGTEMKTLQDARRAIAAERYDDATQLLKNPPLPFLIYKSDADGIIKQSQFKAEVQSIEKLEQQGKNREVAERYLDLAARLAELSEADKHQARLLQEKGMVFKTRDMMANAEQQVTQKDWDKAHGTYSEIASMLEKEVSNPELSASKLHASGASMFIQRLQEAFKAEPASKKEAVDKYRAARRMLTQGLKLPGCDEFVEARLKALDFDEGRSVKLLEEGKAALQKGDYTAASAAFDDALKNNPGDTVAPIFQRYTKDLADCDKSGMSLYSLRSPLRTNKWDNSDRKAAFCIDRYEWPNSAGQMPLFNVNLVEARNLCKQKGKELCSIGQWTDACRGGTNFNEQYPYGNDKRADACNTGSNAAQNAGAKAACRNTIGLFDMSGNLAEWTEDGKVMGGSYQSAVERAHCDAEELFKLDVPHPNVGFRCCRRLKD